MSLWGCNDCGSFTAGSIGAPQCGNCDSYDVGRVTWVALEPEPTITITHNTTDDWYGTEGIPDDPLEGVWTGEYEKPKEVTVSRREAKRQRRAKKTYKPIHSHHL